MVMGLRLFEKTCQLLSMSGLTKVSGVKPWKCPCAARREGASLSCHLALLCGTSFQTLSPSALLLARFLLPLILSTIGIGIGIVLLEAQQADLPNYRESHVQKVTRMKKRKKQNRKD